MNTILYKYKYGQKVTITGYGLGCLRAEYFTLPVGDMNITSYDKFTEGIDFFWQAAQTLGRALKS